MLLAVSASAAQAQIEVSAVLTDHAAFPSAISQQRGSAFGCGPDDNDLTLLDIKALVDAR